MIAHPSPVSSGVGLSHIRFGEPEVKDFLGAEPGVAWTRTLSATGSHLARRDCGPRHARLVYVCFSRRDLPRAFS